MRNSLHGPPSISNCLTLFIEWVTVKHVKHTEYCLGYAFTDTNRDVYLRMVRDVDFRESVRLNANLKRIKPDSPGWSAITR